MRAMIQSLMDLPVAPMEPPTITDSTIYHVGVSGGKDSAAALLWLVRESGIDPERIRASFCNIQNDHQWTLDHVAMLGEKVHPIETIYPEKGFFDLAFEKRRFPSTKARFCTEHLKIYPSADHVMRIRLEGFDPIAVSGVRAAESLDRASLPEWDYSGTLLCIQWLPLLRWTFDDVVAIHRRHNIPLNPLYAIGASRVGCWPCIMSRKAEIRIIALRFPERIDEIRRWEQRFEQIHGRDSSFFPAATVPERFRSKDYRLEDGTVMKVATIDDVVRWSMTGHRAQGSYSDDAEPRNCKSGFCE